MRMTVDRAFILTALIYALVGLLLGEHMGRSGDHGQMPTHAHIMLLGWVFMALYGILYRLWPAMKEGVLSWIHFGLHEVGALLMVIGLFIIYGKSPNESMAGPLLGIGAIFVILGVLLFAYLFFTKGTDATATA